MFSPVQTGGRNKRRNFVPAKIGILSTMIVSVYIPTYLIINSFEVLIITISCYWVIPFYNNISVLLVGYRQPSVHHQLSGGLQSVSDLPLGSRPSSTLHQEKVLLLQLVQQQGGCCSWTIICQLTNINVLHNEDKEK